MLLVIYLNIDYKYQSQTTTLGKDEWSMSQVGRRLCNWYVSVIGDMPEDMNRTQTDTQRCHTVSTIGRGQEQPKGYRADQLDSISSASHSVAVNQYSQESRRSLKKASRPGQEGWVAHCNGLLLQSALRGCVHPHEVKPRLNHRKTRWAKSHPRSDIWSHRSGSSLP